MSPPRSLRPSSPTNFPRVSGDEPWSVKLEVEEVEFSPRERG